MTDDPDAAPGKDPIVGDASGISISEGDQFDYTLSRPDGEKFGLNAAEIPDLRELLDEMQGNG